MCIGIVILLGFLVNTLLLFGTQKVCGCPFCWKRLLPAAILGGAYGGICLLPRFVFLGHILWRVTFIFLIASIAFGWSKSALRRSILFFILSMALEGVAIGVEEGGLWAVACGVTIVALLCAVGLSGNFGGARFIPVELMHGGRSFRFTALYDTGNTLRDPITGRSVLVVGSELASQLTGLTPQQLRKPTEVIATSGIPGLRLIPYRSVGRESGMMLGMNIKNVAIGAWKGNTLVAFSPDVLNGDGSYQALTGGVV